MPLGIGMRKFWATVGCAVLVIGLSFWGLLVEQLDGAEFIKAVHATCALVAAYGGLNVANSVFGGKK